MRLGPVPLDGPKSLEELQVVAGDTITAEGMGGQAALALFENELALACLSNDHPRYLSFIPCAPTEAAALFDLVVGASGIYAGSWLEGAGAVYAENAALRWIANLVGMPAEAGGVFVPGGTIGNLSALVTARSAARARHTASGSHLAGPSKVVAQIGAHSSIRVACDVMDVELVGVFADEHQRLNGENLRAVLKAEGPESFFAVIATAGTTNFGIVDDLKSVAEVCREFGIWFHVDGAYGGAGLAAPTVRHLFAGIEHADSFIVDPHKWLFAPFDCCALLYREPELARAAHAQKASYLDVLTNASEWNPADYSIGLTRRARGLPLWFSLATHGTKAYTSAIERTLEVTRFAEAEIARRPYVEALREADLSVVVFRRLGWKPEDYHAWSAQMLGDGFAFVVPTSHEGETVARFAIVNPVTSEDDITAILDTMA
jgi:glutamate/tyrosine decarboxylase-like PLP-dependent enzyme